MFLSVLLADWKVSTPKLLLHKLAEGHCVKGLATITLHSLMFALACSATVLVKARAGSRRRRWMMEKIG